VAALESTSSDSPLARTALALGLVFAWVLLAFVLPDIALDSEVANLAVGVSDSAYWVGLTLLSVLAVVLLVSRPGLGVRRRTVESAALIGAMIVALAGNALLNEHVIKPTFAVPRPNIVELTEARALGASIHDPDEFYARGDKEARSELLRARLAKLEEPALSPSVREHWITETGYSFPSGHSTAAMTFASMLIALGFWWGLGGWRKLLTNTVVPVWAVSVVYSRVLLEVHSGVDVTFGTLAGFAWGTGASVFVRWCANRFGGEQPP
jgi:phosphatidylglycerophosphatase B